MQIGTLKVGQGEPCAVIAEMSNAHNGSLDRAHRIIDAMKAAGVSACKFQCYTVDELVELRGDGPAPEPWGSQGWTMRTLYEKAQTPHEWFPELVQHCDNIGLPWFSSVFGRESLELLESLNCPAYKIARIDNRSEALWNAVNATEKPIIVSEGPKERAFRPDALNSEMWTLVCFPGYPQTDIAFLGWWFHDHQYDGFSYHGTDILPCVVAATLGAQIVEAHFQLGDFGEGSELEGNVSLDHAQFAAMVQQIRNVEAVLA